ncbi:MAG: GNAT family N-acetyltransferase [Clostridiales bacterium]|nr:GNAT family N-acetyltransferase [Clostridiales bacterium]
MVFEAAKKSDIPALAALRLAYLLEDCGAIPPDQYARIAEGLPSYFQSRLNRDLFAFVCRDGDVLAGCCLLLVVRKPPSPAFVGGKTGTVLNVYTRPGYRKQGIAGELLRMLLKKAAALGLDRVELKATDAGYPLYRSLGFEEDASKYRPMKYVLLTEDAR